MKKQEKKTNNIKTNGTERNAKEGIPVALHLSQKKKTLAFKLCGWKPMISLFLSSSLDINPFLVRIVTVFLKLVPFDFAIFYNNNNNNNDDGNYNNNSI